MTEEPCEDGHQWQPTDVVQKINDTQHLRWVRCAVCGKQEFRVKG
jgi:hypothetical protein